MDLIKINTNANKMNEERNSVLNYLIMKRIFLIKFNLIKLKIFENTVKKDK